MIRRKLTIYQGDEPFPVMTLGDIAETTGQKKDTLTHWVRRAYLHTPEPIGRSVAGALYWWPDWHAWLAFHRPEVLAKMHQTAMGNRATPDSEA